MREICCACCLQLTNHSLNECDDDDNQVRVRLQDVNSQYTVLYRLLET